MLDSKVPVRSTLPVRLPAPARRAAAQRARRQWTPLFGSGVALLLAGAGELLVESGNTSILSLVLYALAIGLFTWTAWMLPPASADLPSEEAAAPRAAALERRGVIVLGAGVVLAILLNGITYLQLRDDIKASAAPWLWASSLGILLVASIVAARVGQIPWMGWAPRWRGGSWPAAPINRLLLAGAVAAILGVAVVARFWALDSIPFGINADEGDRAAIAIQVIHGTNTEGFFGTGWYWISMVYFTMLSWLMDLIGIGYMQARVFGAVAGVIAVGAVTWMGIRHFGQRVGLIAGAITAVLSVALQFSRETSEAGPTATLWAMSVACFLEAARGGRLWAWIAAGAAGGFSIYFYPSGRLWAVVAVLFCGYLFVHGLGGQRRGIVLGSGLAALAAIMVVMPFLVNQGSHPEVLTQRARETSIFTEDNPTRLDYYQHDWNTIQLVTAQTVRSVGVFNQYHDDGGFWPTDRPLMSGLLAVLTLLGLGWVCLRWRDPRYVALAIWFWVGLSGVIVTVETPNVQRLATAVPMLAFLPALVLDNLAFRAEQAFAARKGLSARTVTAVTAGLLGLVTLMLMWQQAGFYFGYYGAVDRWPQPTGLGKGVAAQGDNSLVVTVGRQYHMVNSGWVQLLAPETPRGGVEAAGSNLPLALPADKNLAFLVFPRQLGYLSYLQSLYPGGVTTPYTHTTEGLMFTVYRISQPQWAATQGALAHPPQGGAQPVKTLGEAPAGWTTYPSPMRWTAGLRVPEYWNYAIRVGPGPAKLTIDGNAVLTVPAGTSVLSTTLALARGDHAVTYEGTLTTVGQPAAVEWAKVPTPPNSGDPAPALDWQPVAAEQLNAQQTAPQGLYGVVQIASRPEQHRLDNTLATGSFANQIHTDGNPYTATWTGTLTAPVTGVYSMTLFAQGAVDLTLDGQPVFHSEQSQDEPLGASPSLTAGAHAVSFVFHGKDGPGGIEWTWIPPDGAISIVPPSALAPPSGVGVGPPVPFDVLGRPEWQPTDQGLATIR
jgi:hypothetical protein